MTIRFLTAADRLYPVRKRAVALRWSEGRLQADASTAHRWLRLQVRSQSEPSQWLPVAFDAHHQVPYTDEDWLPLLQLERGLLDARQSPGFHQANTWVKNVDPHARYPHREGPAEGWPFALALVRFGRCPLAQTVRLLTTLGKRRPLATLTFEGASLLDAALLRPLWDAPFLADWLEAQGLVSLAPGCALRCAQILNTFTSRRALRGSTATESRSVSNDLDKVLPLPSGSPPLLMEARLNRSSARWLERLDAAAHFREAVQVPAPQNPHEKAYEGPLGGWLMAQALSTGYHLADDDVFESFLRRAPLPDPSTPVVVNGKTMALDAFVQPSPDFQRLWNQKATALRALWHANWLAYALPETSPQETVPEPARVRL